MDHTTPRKQQDHATPDHTDHATDKATRAYRRASDVGGVGVGSSMGADLPRALRAMSARSGVTMRAAARDMGRAPRYLERVSAGADVRTSTLVQMAAAFGYRVRLVGHGQVITLRLPEQEQPDHGTD